MLKELLPLLRKGDTIGFTLACESNATPGPDGGPPQGARFRINVMPKLFTLDGEKSDARLALNTPITITGTAEELDSPAFVETLTRFTASGTALRHTIDEAETAHKAAAEEKKKVPVKPAATKAVAKPTPKPAGKVASWKDRVKTKAGATTSAPAAAAEPAAEPAEPAVAEPKPGTVEAATPALI